MKPLYLFAFLFVVFSCRESHTNPRVNELFEKGYVALINKDYAQASLYLSEVVSLDSNYLEARNNYAVALWNLGEQEKAWEHISFILVRSPDFKDAWINSYAWSMETGKTFEAYQAADKLYTLFPDSIRFLTLRAQAALDHKSFDQAILDFNLLVTLEGKNYTHWVNRALVFLQTGNFVAAEEDLNQALKLKTFEPLIYNNLAMVCLYGQKRELALNYSENALRINPESTDSKIIYSLCALMNGRLNDGYQILGDTSQYSIVQQSFLFRNLSIYHFLNNQPKNAKQCINRALSYAIYPDFAYYYAAQIALKQGDQYSACVFLEESAKRHEWDASSIRLAECKP